MSIDDQDAAAAGTGTPAGGEATCPHCHKPFVPKPLKRPSARHRGFKCPHCRLFVPLERTEDTALTRDPAS